MPDPLKTDRFWRGLSIVLMLCIVANLLLGYLRKLPEPPPDASAMQVRAVVLAADPKLDRILATVDFNNTTLEQALTDLTHQSDLNLVVLWAPITNLGIEKDSRVNVHLKSVSFVTAMDTLLSVADSKHQLTWNEHGGVVTVGTADTTDKSQLTVRMYDVKPLIQLRMSHVLPPNPTLQNSAQSLQTNQQQQISPEALQLDEIKKLITDNVRPESWKDNGGDIGSISTFGDLLIITQTEQAQQKIHALLQMVGRP